jgi:hypothetical protein
MTYFELLSTEKDFHAKLTEHERRIYTANQEQLAAMSTCNDRSVNQFIEVARLLNELHRMHGRYNKLMEFYDHQFMKENNIEELLDETFCMPISIGIFSAVLDLGCMDECDALYRYLATVKMNRFNNMCDNYDTEMLIDIMVNHNCYNK